jgi:hypothetical protein
MKRALLALGCLLVSVAAGASESPVPSGVRIETKRTESGRITVTVRRIGYFVALRAGDRTSAARDWVAAEIDASAGSEVELGWETTDRATLETSRGGIRVVAADDGPRVSWFSLPAPIVTATHRDRLHECRAFESAPGFSVVCRVAQGARRLSALNLTGDDPLSGVAKADEKTHFVRLDLPVAEGGAEARLMGYLDGNTAVVVRAEASWARGEPRPTLSLADGTRRQLVPLPLDAFWLE